MLRKVRVGNEIWSETRATAARGRGGDHLGSRRGERHPPARSLLLRAGAARRTDDRRVPAEHRRSVARERGIAITSARTTSSWATIEPVLADEVVLPVEQVFAEPLDPRTEAVEIVEVHLVERVVRPLALGPAGGGGFARRRGRARLPGSPSRWRRPSRPGRRGSSSAGRTRPASARAPQRDRHVLELVVAIVPLGAPATRRRG